MTMTGNNALWLVRYSEIFLKSDPVRRQWERILVANIRKVLPDSRARIERGRIWLEGTVDPEKLRKVFGIASFSPCVRCSRKDLHETILSAATLAGLSDCRSFAIRVRRVGTHDFRSQDLARELGDLIRKAYPHLTVDLDAPEREISVEVRDDDYYVFTTVVRGPGGIPLGVEGTLVALMSGGIDSAVAAWMMMKRGCRIVPVFIGLEGYLDESILARAKKVVALLAEFQPDLTLHVIPDAYLQEAREVLRTAHAEKFTCIICKRRMYACARIVAQQCRAKGIVTGESLGQVASQTLDNLAVLSEGMDLPLYRPLIGLDKEEIIRLARHIGTFDASVSPAGSCSAVPRYPATTADIETIHELERAIRAHQKV